MYLRLKRALDIVCSLLALAALSPLLFVLALAVRRTSRGPAIFRQERVGRGGRLFVIYKFRTMKTSAPRMMPTDRFLNADAYVTPVGRFLRRSSLDELPQLVNIFKGDMSFVGPRPALPNQTELLAARAQNGANALRPGLTGWAQINGRDEIPIPVKAGYDGEYANHVSFLFDAKCVAGTLLGRGNPDRLREKAS